MKVEKLVIGKTYYIPQRGCPTNYASGVLVEIVSKNKVILENKKAIDSVVIQINCIKHLIKRLEVEKHKSV